MLEQLINIVKQFGQKTVVENPDVPNEYNREVMADATSTITNGFQNVIAGGGLQNILDMFKSGGSRNNLSSGGIGGLLKNPIVTMMIGYFISKLVSKYKMAPAAASNVANQLIPESLGNLIDQTKDPGNQQMTMDNLVRSLTGNVQQGDQNANDGDSPLQDLLEQFTGGGNNTSSGNKAGFNVEDLVGQFTQKAQNNLQERRRTDGGGLMDMIKGFFN